MIWYRVRDLAAGRAFYTGTLGFRQTAADEDAGWVRLERGGTSIELVEGEPEDGAVAVVEAEDVKEEAARLRAAGVEVGVVVELHGQVRILDVFDPDGNRIQLTEDLDER